MVTDHGSKVLSPATFKMRPLKGTSMLAIVDAGRLAVLQRNVKFVINNKTIREGNLILFNLRDYYIECGWIHDTTEEDDDD